MVGGCWENYPNNEIDAEDNEKGSSTFDFMKNN